MKAYLNPSLSNSNLLPDCFENWGVLRWDVTLGTGAHSGLELVVVLLPLPLECLNLSISYYPNESLYVTGEKINQDKQRGNLSVVKDTNA